MLTFDLLAEAWIPVVTSEGNSEEVGLREVLRRAPQLREIRDPIPLVEFGLYRLLVALVMDAHELREFVQLEDLLAARRFDEAKLDAYFARWVDRFDLFHSRYPFLQAAGMEAKHEKPLAALLPIVPSGINALHFHHYPQHSFSACPAAAARMLTTLAPFTTMGGQGQPQSINGAPPWYLLVLGRSLFETLCFNCCVLPLSQAVGDAPPLWRDDRSMSHAKATRASLLEALTWRPRRVRLVPSGGGRCSVTGSHSPCLVERVHLAPGRFWDNNTAVWIDPNVAYCIASNRTLPLRPREGHEVWRDTGPLALLRREEYQSMQGRVKVQFDRPAVVTQFAELVQQGALSRKAELNLAIYGMRTDQMKVFEWQREVLSLPVPLLWRSAYRTDAQQAMEEAESAAAAFRSAMKLAYPREGKGTAGAFAARIASVERRFWSDLRPHYDALLRTLAELREDAPEEAREACRERWRQQVRRLATGALEQGIGDLDTDADALLRQVNARTALRRRLRALHPGATDAPRRAASEIAEKGGAGR